MKHISVAGIALAVFGVSAQAAELDYGIHAGASYSDNVLRTELDPQSSGAAAVGFDLRTVRDTGRLRYDVYGDVEYRDYFESNIDSQEFGRFIAQTSYAFVPETFDWMLYGSFDQVREDLLRPLAPENLEDVITGSTGPRLTLAFGSGFELQAEAHYTIANYSERDFDNETVGAIMNLGRRLSERSYFGLGASYDDVSYDVAPGLTSPDYERREYFLRFVTEGARTRFEADAGYSEISAAELEDNGPMARMRLTRRLTPYVSGFIAYTREFPTSSGAAFTPEPEQGDLIEDPSVLTAGPRQNQSGELGLTMTRPRTSAAIVYARRKEAGLGTAQDRDFDELSASFTRSITTRSSFGLYGLYTKEKLEDVTSATEVDSDEMVFGSNLHLAFGRGLGVEFRVEYRERDSDVASGSYEELSGGIFLRYGSAPRPVQSQAAP